MRKRADKGTDGMRFIMDWMYFASDTEIAELAAFLNPYMVPNEQRQEIIRQAIGVKNKEQSNG